MVPVGQFSDRDVGEHRFCFSASAEPRQCVRAQKLGFRPGACAHGCFREPVGERTDPPARSRHGRLAEQADVGREVGVDAQCGAADDDLDVVAVVAGGQFGGDEPA